MGGGRIAGEDSVGGGRIAGELHVSEARPVNTNINNIN